MHAEELNTPHHITSHPPPNVGGCCLIVKLVVRVVFSWMKQEGTVHIHDDDDTELGVIDCTDVPHFTLIVAVLLWLWSGRVGSDVPIPVREDTPHHTTTHHNTPHPLPLFGVMLIVVSFLFLCLSTLLLLLLLLLSTTDSTPILTFDTVQRGWWGWGGLRRTMYYPIRITCLLLFSIIHTNESGQTEKTVTSVPVACCRLPYGGRWCVQDGYDDTVCSTVIVSSTSFQHLTQGHG